jgi:hypothetical protein
MIYVLFLTLPLAGWLLYKLPFWEADRDYAAIKANGSADTLKERFHFLRALRRGLIQGGIAGVAAAPLAPTSFPAFWLLAAALGVGGLTWFFNTFNTKLSLLRGLDPYYISFATDAALFPDQLIAVEAMQEIPHSAAYSDEETLAHRKEWAGERFKLLLKWCLWLGVGAAFLLACAAVLVAYNS